MHIKKLIGQGYTGPMDPEGLQQKHVSDTPPPPPKKSNKREKNLFEFGWFLS